MSCSDIQGDVLTAMYSLVDHTLADWPADKDKPPDQHYQMLLLRAISIILLNPWIDDDQIGRRCICPLPCSVSVTALCSALCQPLSFSKWSSTERSASAERWVSALQSDLQPERALHVSAKPRQTAVS